MRRWTLALVFVVACGGDRDAEPAYEGCDLDNPEVLCADETECVESLVVADGNGFCTVTCAVGADPCPASESGLSTGCHEPDGALGAQCYAECPNDDLCPPSTVCVTFDEAGAEVALCVPR